MLKPSNNSPAVELGQRNRVTTRMHTQKSSCDDCDALQKKVAELEKINEQLSQFAWIAAHDLQEPMRKIMAFGKLLDPAIETSNSVEIERAKTAILKAASRASELIDELLTYARVSNGRLDHDILDLQEQMKLALDDLSESIRETGAEIDLQVPSIPFKADSLQFARLMQNILSNAIKYRKPGQTPKVRVTASYQDKNIVLAIADDGIGFEQDFAELIFQPFSRLNGRSKYPGCGIGLAICKSICDREGWEISVLSQPQQGTTFYIRIPTLTESRVEPVIAELERD